MRKLWNRIRYSEFFYVFNFRNSEAKGRSCLLINVLLVNVGNVLSTGLLYTGFLAEYGIDIVSVGVITIVPYLAWLFSLFSPVVLSRFKKRRGLLIFNSIFFHVCTTLAVTVIPMLVSDTQLCLLIIGVLIFLGNLSNALLGSGATAWHVNFLQGKAQSAYFAYQTLFGAVISAVTGLFSSLLADSLSGSPNLRIMLGVLRFAAFAIFVINTLQLYLIPKEYPYNNTKARFKPMDVVKISAQSTTFLLTAVFVFFWHTLCYLNASTWNYYLLNTAGYSYSIIFFNTIIYAVFSIFFMRLWKHSISKISWYSTMLICLIVAGLMEFAISLSTAKTPGIYIAVAVIQNFNAVGINLLMASLFYINLPEQNHDIHAMFWNFCCNMGMLVGSALGAWFIAAVGDHVGYFLGLPYHSSQYLVIIKGGCMLLCALYLYLLRGRLEPKSGYYARPPK